MTLMEWAVVDFVVTFEIAKLVLLVRHVWRMA